jgi:hypothetical protein
MKQSYSKEEHAFVVVGQQTYIQCLSPFLLVLRLSVWHLETLLKICNLDRMKQIEPILTVGKKRGHLY